MLLLLLLVACFPKADQDDSGDTGDDLLASDSGDGGSGDNGSGDNGSGDNSGDNGADTGPDDDQDDDGVNHDDGDCEDFDETIYPGADESTCNGVDNDCDDEVDEDFDGDTHEPNDDRGGSLGALGEKDQADATGYIFPEGDEDRFRFDVEDGSWSWFSITVELTDVPNDVDLALSLSWVEDPDGADKGRVAYSDDGGVGGSESLYYGGDTFYDDSGTYEVLVTSSDGTRCDAPYTVRVTTGE